MGYEETVHRVGETISRFSYEGDDDGGGLEEAGTGAAAAAELAWEEL